MNMNDSFLVFVTQTPMKKQQPLSFWKIYSSLWLYFA